MKIYNDYSLSNLNAFKLKTKAKYFAKPKTRAQLGTLLKLPKFIDKNVHILGDGTNTLFKGDYNGLVIKVNIKGIKIIKETKDGIQVQVGAGENWDKFVLFAINNGWSGIENMSFIPGTVGAAPVQNIAAYGQNFEDVFVSLDAIHLKSGKLKHFGKKDCFFGYRDSLFKNKHRNEYVIISVVLQLGKNPRIDTTYHSRYDSIKSELEKTAKTPYSISDVRHAVINIRTRKFPDWKKVGTAGSFFLNPVISKSKLKEIQKKYPNVQYYLVDKLTYPQPNDPKFNHAEHVKIAAGWLLEELGWKGKRLGNIGTSPNQSLVIINYKNASYEEIIRFAEKIQNSFFDNFGIALEYEVNII